MRRRLRRERSEEAKAHSEALGRRLREVREARKVSLRTLADRSGVCYSYLSQIERGLRTFPLVHLSRLAEALDVSPTALTEGRVELASERDRLAEALDALRAEVASLRAALILERGNDDRGREAEDKALAGPLPADRAGDAHNGSDRGD